MDTKKRFEQLESVRVDILTKQDELSIKQDAMLGHIGLLVDKVSKIDQLEGNVEIIAEKVARIDTIEKSIGAVVEKTSKIESDIRAILDLLNNRS